MSAAQICRRLQKAFAVPFVPFDDIFEHELFDVLDPLAAELAGNLPELQWVFT